MFNFFFSQNCIQFAPEKLLFFFLWITLAHQYQCLITMISDVNNNTIYIIIAAVKSAI